jgi:hypothetical protein
MAETQKPSTGYNGEVHLSSDATAGNLEELVQVVSFSLPSDTGERVETTHLKSPNRRRQYTSGMIDPGEIEITLNFRPGSDTDVAIEGALSDGDERYLRLVIPELGVPTWQYDLKGVILTYDKGTVEADGKMEATVTFAINTLVSSGAYSTPTP